MIAIIISQCGSADGVFLGPEDEAEEYESRITDAVERMGGKVTKQLVGLESLDELVCTLEEEAEEVDMLLSEATEA